MSRSRGKRQLATIAAALATLAIWAPAGGDAAPVPSCPSFTSQAAAQTYFGEQGGSPAHGVGRLDPDHDGVACEGLGAPYQGYATIAYNKKRKFFYGVATMPPLATGNGEFACLTGNRYEPESPRLLKIFRVKADGDVSVLGSQERAAEAKPSTGKLFWKADKAGIPHGRYYVAFEASIRSSAYAPTPCPEFRSAITALPAP
jgi:Excalibur calcium-binding domain